MAHQSFPSDYYLLVGHFGMFFFTSHISLVNSIPVFLLSISSLYAFFKKTLQFHVLFVQFLLLTLTLYYSMQYYIVS